VFSVIATVEKNSTKHAKQTTVKHNKPKGIHF